MTFTKPKPGDGEPQIVWERALDKYRKATGFELIIGSETGTAGAIYVLLAFVFYKAFKGFGQEPDTIAEGSLIMLLAIALAFVATSIIVVYVFRHYLIYRRWRNLIDEIEQDAWAEYGSSDNDKDV